MVKDSKFDGRFVVYRDPAGAVHAGDVVGQSDDGNWFYIAPDYATMGIDKPDGDEVFWHIHRDRIGEIFKALAQAR